MVPRMPVYHFIFHGYGTWHPDHESGWHQHGVGRPLKPQIRLGQIRRRLQRFPTVTFSPDTQQSLVDMSRDICRRRDWRCHATAANETHIHIVASWRDVHEAMDVHHTFKRILAWHLAQLRGEKGRHWLAHGGYPKRVEDMEHLGYLVREYLPDQGGVFWSERRNDG